MIRNPNARKRVWRPRQDSSHLNYTPGSVTRDRQFAVPALVLPAGSEFWAERLA